MALIVENGTIVAGAESFISAAAADSYFSNRSNAAWAALGSAAKEAALRMATDYMQGAYRDRWAGTLVSATQPLAWPRAWVPIKDSPYGYGAYVAYVANNVVPAEVQRACAELALIASASALAPTMTRAKQSVTAGPVSVTYDPASPEAPRYRQADLMLSQYLISTGAMARLARV